jgi:ABC-type branched-subunit amino acid transport system substrate-binding protein
MERSVIAAKSWVTGLALLLLAAGLAVSCSDGDRSNERASPAAPSGEDVQGVTDTEIKLGTHMPLSQTPAAAYATIADGLRAYFNYINDTEGGVYGRKISLLVGDDHYLPADTVEVVQRLVEQDKVFAIISGLGDLTHAAVAGYLEERGVPDLFVNSGLARWTDPVVRTRFGGNPVYLQEGDVLGRYIVREYDGKKLGMLIENQEGGFEGEEGVRRGIAGSDVEVVAVETYEPVQWDVAAQTQRLRNAGAEVVVVYATPPPAASLLKTAREVMQWDVPVVVSGVDSTDLFLDLAGRDNAEGIISVVFGHQVYEQDNPGVQKHYQIMEEYAPGVPVSNLTLYGATMAQLLVEGLKRAGPDLTRDSLIDALESIRDVTCDACLAPVSLSPTDHRPAEVVRYVRVEDGVWAPFGDLVSFESTP